MEPRSKEINVAKSIISEVPETSVTTVNLRLMTPG